jgi:hypothetical protein
MNDDSGCDQRCHTNTLMMSIVLLGFSGVTV